MNTKTTVAALCGLLLSLSAADAQERVPLGDSLTTLLSVELPLDAAGPVVLLDLDPSRPAHLRRPETAAQRRAVLDLLQVHADGREVPRQDSRGRPDAPPALTLVEGRPARLRVELSRAFRLPEQWGTLSMTATGALAGTLESTIEVRARTRPEATVDVAVRLPRVLDPEHPMARLDLLYVGDEEAYRLRVPEGPQWRFFRSLSLWVDGAPAAFRSPTGPDIDPKATRELTLRPGVAQTVSVDLSRIWEVPARWSRLELRPANVFGPDGGLLVSQIVRRRGGEPSR